MFKVKNNSFIVNAFKFNLEHTSHLFVLFHFLTLSMYLFTGVFCLWCILAYLGGYYVFKSNLIGKMLKKLKLIYVVLK